MEPDDYNTLIVNTYKDVQELIINKIESVPDSNKWLITGRIFNILMHKHYGSTISKAERALNSKEGATAVCVREALQDDPKDQALVLAKEALDQVSAVLVSLISKSKAPDMYMLEDVQNYMRKIQKLEEEANE